MQFNLADLFERVADTVPDHLAVVDGDRRITYVELDERATRLANGLAREGIGRGDHVALYLYNCVEYLETMIAAFKLRAVPVNVNYRYVEGELRYLLDDADARAIVHHAEFAPKLEAIRADLPLLRTFVAVSDGTRDLPEATLDYDTLLERSSPERAFAPRSADDLYILYTGGTTGMPKGVMWRHEDVFFGAMGGGGGGGRPIDRPDDISERCRIPRVRCLPACPFMHGTAHWMALSVLLLGGTVVVARQQRLDPVALWALVASESVNFMVIVGDAFGRPLLDALDDPRVRNLDLSGLGVLLSGGAILSPTIKRALVEQLPGLAVVDGYGASETGGQGQSVVVAGSDVSDAPRFRVGDDTQVLDDDLRPVAVGVTGRLARRGRVPLGYYKDRERSATTFPVIEGERWAITGDHAVVEPDGSITLLGRGSVVINTGGEKVHPEEIETALKSHASVLDAVVVGVPDERWGERVVAVVQLRHDTTTRAEDLRAHVRRTLAGYKVPRDIVLVEMIERSPSGKADYRWARASAAGAVG